jgi:hypothetical protein
MQSFALRYAAPLLFAWTLGFGPLPALAQIAPSPTFTVISNNIANASSTGTTLNKLAKLTGAPSTAVETATTDTGGIIGVVIGGAGTTGNAQVAREGLASCVFDGATTAGDYVVNSTTTTGDCHDVGAPLPATTQVIGRILSTNGAAGTYQIFVYPVAGVPAVDGLTIVGTSGILSAQQPYFEVALITTNQSVTANTATKAQFNSTVEDSNSWWTGSSSSVCSSSTGYCYKPQLAGIYEVCATIFSTGSTAFNYTKAYIYKNGSAYASTTTGGTSEYNGSTACALVPLNGSTDYVEGWGLIEASTNTAFTAGSAPYVTFMYGHFIHA